jgi:hypothetical protein
VTTATATEVKFEQHSTTDLSVARLWRTKYIPGSRIVEDDFPTENSIAYGDTVDAPPNRLVLLTFP